MTTSDRRSRRPFAALTLAGALLQAAAEANGAVGITALGRQFVPRPMTSRLGTRPSALGGKYVLVLPYEVDARLWSTAR